MIVTLRHCPEEPRAVVQRADLPSPILDVLLVNAVPAGKPAGGEQVHFAAAEQWVDPRMRPLPDRHLMPEPDQRRIHNPAADLVSMMRRWAIVAGCMVPPDSGIPGIQDSCPGVPSLAGIGPRSAGSGVQPTSSVHGAATAAHPLTHCERDVDRRLATFPSAGTPRHRRPRPE